MCELEPPISVVPDAFITGLEFDVFPISVKYLQEYSFWESIVMGRHPRQLLKTMARAEYPQNKTYRFVRRTLAVERVNIVDSTPEAQERRNCIPTIGEGPEMPSGGYDLLGE
jgi:hypothetical protein